MARRAAHLDRPEQREAAALALRSGAMSLAEACRAIRAMHGLSQQALADACGLSLNVVKALESGRGNPKLDSLEKLAGLAGLKVVFAAPGAVVRLGDMRERVEAKEASRRHDRRRVEAGAAAGALSSVNSLSEPGLPYELPAID